ncbi:MULTISPECIES: class I SAM-dependent methyltransferase [Streptomyces]|uniref:class I SAM-dependent methyltransferase n=1 Tax=Streptomyces TaxID=1883 RepID=UPI0023DD2C15|nr:class I SAM-dependent methyltransferase [Streptomyces sp. FXJ1.172]WEP00920.1 class I SAM-dependent methyltransferase [Streptomyces sp. FXJ1.172]
MVARLWLARALAADLVGVDLSSTAVELAEARRSRFVPPRRARFQVGTIQATGLPDRCAHGLVCVDVVTGTADWTSVLAEMRRVLAPGARAVLTRTVRRDSGEAWRAQVERAGLEIEHVDERPEEPQVWRNLYRLWITHEADLRRELGGA